MKKMKILLITLSLMMVIPWNATKAEVNTNTISTITSLGENKYKVESTLSTTNNLLEKNIDIVLVMDKSSASDIEGYKESISLLVNSLKEEANYNIKMGVIWFNKNIHQGTEGMLSLKDEENVEKILTAVNSTSGSGTNVHGAVKLAQEWLNADTTVKAEQKYMILVTDFGGYIFTDENGVSVSRYAGTGSGVAVSNHDIIDKYGEDNSIVDFDNITISDIDNLVNNGILLNGTLANEILLKEIGIKSSEYAWDGNVSNWENLIPWSKIREADYPTINEKNAYLIGNQLLDIKELNYNVISVTRKYYPNIPQGKTTNMFANWIEENIGNRYEIEENTAEEIFNNIHNNIFTVMTEGTITQTLNENISLNFESINIEINNTNLPKEVQDNKIMFGEQNSDGRYPYELLYNIDENQIELRINTEVKQNTNNLLTYEFDLKDNLTQEIVAFTNEKIEYKTAYGILKGESSIEEFDAIKIVPTTQNPNTTTSILLILTLSSILIISILFLKKFKDLKIQKYNN